MSIVIATTTITVRRARQPATEDPYGEGYDDAGDRDPAVDVVASEVRATIAPASTRGSDSGGSSQVAEFKLACDPCGLSHLDTVVDDHDGTEYAVLWAVDSPGVAGLGHVIAGLQTIKGRPTS